MKYLKYILFSFVVFIFASCFDDKSTDATTPLSDITIEETGLSKVYNINKNDTLVIKPVVKQANKDLTLSYTWELDQAVVSTEPVFKYVGSKLGTFSGRLVVQNDDGKAFFLFTLNVNSPYEYGITVLSKDKQGRPLLSFMQDSMQEGDTASFYNENCFTKNNPDLFFASNPTDIIQTKGSLIIACQGSDNSKEDKATIYFLNEKTFVMENLVDGSEYSSFKPTKLFTPSSSYEGSAYPVLSSDGKMYSLPTYNAVLQPSHNLLSTYAQTGFVVGESASYFEIILWDKEVNGLTLIYNGYGPYYCGKKYLLQKDSLSNDEYYNKNFSKLKGVKTVIPIRLTPEQKKTYRRELITIVQAKLSLQKVVISTFFWEPIPGKIGEYEILDNNGFTKTANKKDYALINETTPCIANATYKTMFFPDGNKVMRWYYSKDKKDTNDKYYLEDADVLLTVGSESAVITGFEISDDHKKTYVAFYEPDSDKELNGSVWVFDTDNGNVLETYNNVCYQPVKMIYKKK